MANSYYYSSTAGTYTLTGSISSSATAVVLSSVTGLPSNTPFKVVIDPGQGTEEIVKVTAVAGMTLTVVRGHDGSTPAAHAAGAVVRHMMTAEDLTLARTHEAATAGVHGISGSVVGTTDSQSLTNKSLMSPTNTFPTSLATLTGGQVLTNKDLTSGTNTFPASLATLSGSQTLTNKVLNGSNNTFSNIPESAVTGLTTDLAGLDARLDALEADSGWVAITVSGGKLAHGTNPPQVRKIGNRVFIRGGFEDNGVVANAETQVGTVPVGYRPSDLPVYINVEGSTGNQYSMAVINTSGAVFIRASSSLPDYFLFPGELNGWFV